MPERAAIPEEFTNLDFTFEKHKLMHEHKWSPEFVDLLHREYVSFLFLVRKHPTVRIVPSGTIDQLWHLHILDTQRYEMDCMRLFGRFLHHEPEHVLLDTAQGNKQWKQQAWRETLTLYQQSFGEIAPPEMWGDAPPCGPARP